MKSYIEVKLTASPDAQEPLMALLDLEGYEAFEMDDVCLKAYIEEGLFKPQPLDELQEQFGLPDWTAETMPDKNWNAEWEANYQPVALDDFCFIYPSFYQLSDADRLAYEHLVEIQPQMSFGTGHHETTRLVARLMREVGFQDKIVADVGCGTGVLGILAYKLGAKHVDFIDFDPVCVQNTNENLALNTLERRGSQVWEGEADRLPEQTYEVLIANINRNVLIHDAPRYRAALQPHGRLLLSGFFDFDAELILETFGALGFQLVTQTEDNNWQALHLILS